MRKQQLPVSSNRSDWTPALQQAAFRQIMNCFAYPGRVGVLETEAEHALPLLLATLVDREVSLADPQALLDEDEQRRLGAHLASPEKAQFVIYAGQCPPDFVPALGSLENPEQGATLILIAESLATGASLHLTGPGIPDKAAVSIQGVDPAWWQKRERWNSGFPMGVDMIVVAGRQVLGLPRTTRLTAKGA